MSSRKFAGTLTIALPCRGNSHGCRSDDTRGSPHDHPALRDGSCGSGDHPSDHDAQFCCAELITASPSSTFAFVLGRSLVAGQLSVQSEDWQLDEMATRLQWWRDRLRDPEDRSLLLHACAYVVQKTHVAIVVDRAYKPHFCADGEVHRWVLLSRAHVHPQFRKDTHHDGNC